jgi:hypothetical protein
MEESPENSVLPARPENPVQEIGSIGCHEK